MRLTVTGAVSTPNLLFWTMVRGLTPASHRRKNASGPHCSAWVATRIPTKSKVRHYLSAPNNSSLPPRSRSPQTAMPKEPSKFTSFPRRRFALYIPFDDDYTSPYEITFPISDSVPHPTSPYPQGRRRSTPPSASTLRQNRIAMAGQEIPTASGPLLRADSDSESESVSFSNSRSGLHLIYISGR
jgi:hypothetical protein